MVEMSEPCRAVALALLGAGLAWQTAEELALASGGDLDATADALARLDLDGWISVWDRPEGPVVTFSPLGAERLGIRLVESGPGEVPRWASRGDPEPPAPPAKHVARSARSAWLSDLIDPHASAERLAELAEAAGTPRAEGEASRGAAGTKSDPNGLPRPTVLIGQGHTPWPGPGTLACPVCSGRPLGSQMYCLNCDRWGLDHLLGPRPTRTQSAPRVSAADPARVIREAAEARGRRKVARSAKRHAKAAGDRKR